MLPIQPNPRPDRVPDLGSVPSSVTRRGFISQAAGVGASLGMGALFGGSLRQAAAETSAPSPRTRFLERSLIFRLWGCRTAKTTQCGRGT